jgi:peroxiredoxin
MILAPGTKAPDFALAAGAESTLTLSQLRGRNVVIAFYPADFSPVCSDQMALYNELGADLDRLNAQLLGISVDSMWCHAAFAASRHLHFPLLADFEPKGQVARAYGAYRTKDGVAERALFVIDRDSVIRWSYLSPVDVNPGADGFLDALEAL